MKVRKISAKEIIGTGLLKPEMKFLVGGCGNNGGCGSSYITCNYTLDGDNVVTGASCGLATIGECEAEIEKIFAELDVTVSGLKCE